MPQPPPPGTSPSEVAAMGKRQLDYAEERYHRLIAAVHHQYHIDERPSVPRQVSFVAPSQYHKVTFEAYKDRILESMEAAVDPRDRSPVFIQTQHEMFRSNPQSLEGDILYLIGDPHCWAFIEYYHSPARTTGRKDWDIMFATLRSTPRRDAVPCMHAATDFGCHISNCPFRHPPLSEIAALHSTLIEGRRLFLTTPSLRNRFTFVRNTCNLKINNAVMEESKTLTAICDNGLCAKKEKSGGGNLLICGGCGWARYCSADCQKRCRKRHKLVCVKTDRLIEDDHLWTTEGHLKGQPTLQDEMEEGVFIGKIV